MIVTTKELFKHAYGKYAVGGLQHQQPGADHGLFQGNLDSKAPFIVQLSKGARSYTHKKMVEALIRAADEIFPDAVFAVHLDHGDEATCMDCIGSGFLQLVMIDASAEPLDKNIEITRRVVEAAHAKGIVVEGRTGQAGRGGGARLRQGGGCQAHRPGAAKEFVTRSGCDSLACAIATSHGATSSRAAGPAFRSAEGNPETHARLPAGHARVELRPAGRGRAHQRRRRTARRGEGRGRKPVRAGGQAGRDQGQH